MRRNAALVLLAAVLVSACQTSAPHSPGASSSPVAAADQRLFAGDYDGAEAAYRALIDAGGSASAPARLHYSLLLDYTNRFQEALAMASAAGTTDSAGLGRLTRALDWTAEVPGALEAGARAVAATPVDPAARAFYAEALADAGRYEPARQQLELAQRSARDSFTVAEVERDWANYFRSKGDQLEELNHLQLSLRAQPTFPERQLEMARFDYANNRSAEGDGIVGKVEKAHPHDYRLLTAIGDSLFLKGDPAGAGRVYREALLVRPGAPEASLGLAEVEVAAQRDFSAAHDQLLSSLKANPSAGAVREFLRQLDLLVLQSDPSGDLGGPGPAADALAAPRAAALTLASSYRRTAGLPALTEDPALAGAALAHAYYWLFNFGQPSEQGVGVHAEARSLPGFTGADAVHRAAHFGYPGPRAAEDIAHTYSARSAVEHWVDTVFHRLPILDQEAGSAGYGEAQVGAIAIQVLEVGLGPSGRAEPVVYPAADATGVPGVFVGGEVPEPLPASAVYPAGYPITLTLGSAYTLQVTAASLTSPAGADVAFYAIQPESGAPLNGNQFAMVPQRPLRAGRYTVQISGFASGQRLQAAWQFTVGGP